MKYVESIALLIAAFVLILASSVIFGVPGFFCSMLIVIAGMIALNSVSTLGIFAAILVVMRWTNSASWWPIAINPTPSIPQGIYWHTHESSHRGVVVSFPQPHRPGVRIVHPYGLLYLIKYVAAMPGDTVEVAPAEILVNGHRWPNSQPPSAPNPLDHRLLGRHIVPPGHMWVMGTNSDSFDSRFFGEVPMTSILYTARPNSLFGIPGNKLCNDTGTSPNPCFLRVDSVFSK